MNFFGKVNGNTSVVSSLCLLCTCNELCCLRFASNSYSVTVTVCFSFSEVVFLFCKKKQRIENIWFLSTCGNKKRTRSPL